MGKTFLWFDRFVRERKEVVTGTWLDAFMQEYGSGYCPRKLREGGETYYDLLMNLDIPASPDHPIVRNLSLQTLEKRIPFKHIMASHTLWRDVLMNEYWEFMLQNNADIQEATSFIRKLQLRIDLIQMYTCLNYWEHANRRLDNQEEHIDHLHQDRLNMIGKMAASMAHEIRNPLTSISGFLKMVRAQLSDESKLMVTKYLDIIDREMKVLLGQITGFLSFSRNNGVEETYVTCTVEEIVLSVQELTEPRLNNDGIELELDLEDGALITIQKTALQQVLINLINNSADALQDVEYSGQIRIFSRKDDKFVYIDVEDNGPGIPEPILQDVFSAFYTTKRNGTGIGLAICKQIVEKNAGAISYSSRAGKTVFTIVLQKEKGEDGAV